MTTINWNARVWRLAGPIILSNISVPLLGVVDIAVMGQLEGAHYIGAVAVGAQLFSIIYWGFGFLQSGTSGFTAQALGLADPDQVRTCFMRGLILAALAGLGILVLQQGLLWAALEVIAPSDHVAQLAGSYYHIRVWGAPFVFTGYVLLGWFVGIQNTVAVLLIQLGMNLTNIILDLLFVLYFGWGIEGVAWATLISEVGAAIFGLWLAMRYARKMGGAWRFDLLRQWDKFRALLLLNRDIFLRTLCLQMAFVSATAIGARMGDTTLAANAVLFSFFSLMAYGLDGFAHAVETLSGHAWGARNHDNFRGAVKASVMWAAGFSIPACLVFWFFGGTIIDLLAATESVRVATRQYLPWLAIMPLLSVWSFLLDGIFFGMTRGPDMRNAMLMSLIAYAIAAWFLVEQYGNHGLWAAFCIFMVARAITLGGKYPGLNRLFSEKQSD